MDLKEILSISGKPGLFKNIAQSKAGVIVESLIDGKRFQIFSNDKISALGEISIYTDTEDMPIREVFRLIHEKYSDHPVPGNKADDKDFVSFFESIVPQYDKERFYVSHMRKIVSWYTILIDNGINDFSQPEVESEGSSTDSSGGDPVATDS